MAKKVIYKAECVELMEQSIEMCIKELAVTLLGVNEGDADSIRHMGKVTDKITTDFNHHWMNAVKSDDEYEAQQQPTKNELGLK